MVGRYRQRYPQVVLELNSNEGHAGLLERRIDLAIRFGPLNDSSLRSRLAVPLTPAIVSSHGSPARPGTSCWASASRLVEPLAPA